MVNCEYVKYLIYCKNKNALFAAEYYNKKKKLKYLVYTNLDRIIHDPFIRLLEIV